MLKESDLPIMLTADEVAGLLRMKRSFVYKRRHLIPGATRIGRRLLFRRDRVLQYLRDRESSVPSPEGQHG